MRAELRLDKLKGGDNLGDRGGSPDGKIVLK